MHRELDKHIYTRLLLFTASTQAGYFKSTLMKLFLGANIKQERATRSSSSKHNPDKLTITFAPVKGFERTLVKFHEYASMSDAAQWPVTPLIRDSLRAKIEAPDGDSFVDALNSIMSTFDVRTGNGRCKNNLRAKEHTPPNILINVVVSRPGMPEITAEVQIFLRAIEEIMEHRHYEVGTGRQIALLSSCKH